MVRCVGHVCLQCPRPNEVLDRRSLLCDAGLFHGGYSFPERCKDERGLLTEGAFISKIVASQGLGDQHSLISGEIWLILKESRSRFEPESEHFSAILDAAFQFSFLILLLGCFFIFSFSNLEGIYRLAAFG
jgi:hypothetical protein